jgi:hypothetical protein
MTSTFGNEPAVDGICNDTECASAQEINNLHGISDLWTNESPFLRANYLIPLEGGCAEIAVSGRLAREEGGVSTWQVPGHDFLCQRSRAARQHPNAGEPGRRKVKCKGCRGGR